MPIFFFNVRQGEEAGYSSEGVEFADHGAAWKRNDRRLRRPDRRHFPKTSENAEWQMELLDESRKPVVRIRLIAQTLQDND